MEAERRQVTVLFTDMVGFTTFSERSGEEAAFTLMRSLSKLMDDAVREQGGVVQSFTGDGIMAVFGAPVAFEDAPLRACRAALSILQRLKTDGSDLEIKHGVRPHLRIGLNTGAAVVGKVQGGADAGVTVLGDTVNFAARLQALAEPDSAVMSEATHRSVQGMVEASFAGEHPIKGKSEAQKVYRLDGIRHGAARFEAAVSRGLSTFVGREHELEVLERGLADARSQLRVIDIAAEPGMGKSRLLHEFRQRVGKERAFVLSGNCSPDGQQTPFLPFVEVVRGSFRVSAGEAEKDVAQKLEIGLTSLGLHSTRNLGLLLHLLGLKVPEGALTGLDGVLIGLRTRELLQQLLDARCSLSPVVIVIEDLHWIDSVSEELLGKIVGSESKLKLLLLTTHRREFAPPWLDRAVLTQLHLEPLPVGDIRRLVQARLVEVLPEALTRQVAEKAEGNPLFAEEIVSFLTERGMLHAKGGKLEFDPGAVAAALPASVQSILNARVDRLSPKDRALLQAASVIGRRFDSELLAVAAEETDIGNRLASMQALDLVHADGGSTGYVFKHVLVRDALYESLLTERRQGLHARIAEGIEHRSGNRLAEVAEILAYHYSHTSRVGKAFAYLYLAGTKSLSIYSLDEAATHLTAALALLDKNPDCASDAQVTDFLLSYLPLLDLSAQVKREIDVLPRYLPRIDRLGDDLRAVLIRTTYVGALFMNARYREAAAMQRETSRLADRLGDAGSKAWALVIEMSVSTFFEPKPLHEFEILKTEAIKAASDATEVFSQKSAREVDGLLQVAFASGPFRNTWMVIGWEEAVRGRMNDARDAARELMQGGRLLNDPRSTSTGLWLLSLIALMSESYAEALEYSEQSLAVAVTPVDRNFFSTAVKLSALVALRRTEEGAMLLEAYRRRCVADGQLHLLTSTDTIFGACKILQGNIRDGLRLLEDAILRRENEGVRDMADWARLNLAEIYLRMIAGNEKPPPLSILLRNLPTILRVMMTAHSRIPDLLKRVMANPHFDPAGHHIGRAQMILGLFYKVKKKRALAVQHLTEAQRILSQFGTTPILARVDTALAELEQ